MIYPHHHRTAGESALAGHLADAEAALMARPLPTTDELIRDEADAEGLIATPVEHLRWFDLTRRCLRADGPAR